MGLVRGVSGVLLLLLWSGFGVGVGVGGSASAAGAVTDSISVCGIKNPTDRHP